MIQNTISNLLNKNNLLMEEAKRNIQEIYLADQRPWVVGYSGGKDSTTVVQLVFEALNALPKDQLHKKVYVISSDTLVETPLIIQSINTTLRRIQESALERGLPFETHKVKPLPEQSFWANIIGRGYPSPNQTFRWCTDRLKIDPANRFIMDKVDKFGEVIMVLGVRENESSTRDNVIKSHSVEGEVLMKHSTLSNAYVFAPIRQFSTEDVWDYLLNEPSPWGDDNHALNKLYQDSNSSECPLVVDKEIKDSAGSCGNSRFGCWVCTVVNEDKSLNGFIQSGSDWLRPLLEFRNWLASIRDDRRLREKNRKNGGVYYQKLKHEKRDDTTYVIIPEKRGSRARREVPVEDFDPYRFKKKELKQKLIEHEIDLNSPDCPEILIEMEDEKDQGEKYALLGLGPFTIEARQEILIKLLETQRDLTPPGNEELELIREEELKVIRRLWFEDGEWKDPLPGIYRDIMGTDLDWEYDDRPLFTDEQVSDLELLCQDYGVDFKMLKKLVFTERQYAGYKVRRGVHREIERVLNQGYLHL